MTRPVADPAQNLSPQGWWDKLGLKMTAKGVPIANVDNVVRVLRGHPRFGATFWFDEFHQRIRTNRGEDGERSWRDADDIEILVWLQGELLLGAVTLGHVQQATTMIAMDDRRREPFTWLLNLAWDNYHRLDRFAELAFGVEPSPYAQAVGENLIKSIAVRQLQPGAKVDTMVVLEGPQGIGKTQALQALGGAWYGELHSGFGTKDAIQELAGKWLIEVAELQAMSKRESEGTKAWLSRTIDTFRPPYGRHAVDVPRTCVFVGTTNESTYLRDATGARRFWPLRCGTVNVEWIRNYRDQLFAEAFWRLQAQGETWWEVPQDQATREQESRYEGDPWTEPIQRWLVGRDTATTSEILTDAVRLDIGRQTKREQMRVAAILRKLEWERALTGTGRHRVWRRTTSEPPFSKVAHLEPRAQLESDPPEPHEPPVYL